MADRKNWMVGQLVSESEMDSADAALEQADRNFAIDADLALVDLSTTNGGILSGGTVDHSSGNPLPQAGFNARAQALRAYDNSGRRLRTTTSLNTDVSRIGQTSVGAAGTPDGALVTPAAGNERWVSLYIFSDRLLSDPRVDGTGATVYFKEDESFRFFVKAGAEVPAPAPSTPDPALESGKVLLADIRISNTQMLEINTTRRMDWIVRSGTAYSIRKGTPREAIADVLSDLNGHVAGSSGRHAASTVDYAGGSDWADTAGGATTNPAATVEVQLDKVITDLVATTASHSGAHKVGAASVSGTPFSLSAGNIGSQIASVVSRYNGHVDASADRHAAAAIDYAGSGNFANGADALTAANVEVSIDTFVQRIADSGATGGSHRLGSSATSGGALGTQGILDLSAGTLYSQLTTIRDYINSRVRRAGDTMTGDLTPASSAGAGLGTLALPWKLIALKSDATTSTALDLRPFSTSQTAALGKFFHDATYGTPASVITSRGQYLARAFAWRDEFMYFSLAALDNFYLRTTAETGSVSITSAGADSKFGVARLITVDASDSAEIESFDVFDPAVAPKQHLIARVRKNNVASVDYSFGWRRDDTPTTRYIRFHSVGTGAWDGSVADGGAESTVAITGSADTNYHIFEIIVRSATSVDFIFDGTVFNLSATLPVASGANFFELFGRDFSSGGAGELDIDWWEVQSDAY